MEVEVIGRGAAIRIDYVRKEYAFDKRKKFDSYSLYEISLPSGLLSSSSNVFLKTEFFNSNSPRVCSMQTRNANY